MSKELLKKIYFIFKRYLSTLLSMFAVFVGCYGFISVLVFNQYILPLNYVLMIFITACIVAAILTGILIINKLNFIVQAVLIYVIVTISIYFVGFYTNRFTRDNDFWLFSIIINLVCISLLFGIITIKRTLENKKLNSQLQKYQERDK